MKRGATQLETCHLNGWTVGTLLAGDEGYGETIIRLTAIGERRVLAKMVSHDGEHLEWPVEHAWVLDHRDWREVSP